jgi:hypothetical protein
MILPPITGRSQNDAEVDRESRGHVRWDMANAFWTRAGGVGGIVFFVSLGVLIALMPLSYSVSEPAFDASSSAFLAYAKSESNLPFALELVGVLGLFGFIVFGAVLADRVRVEGERSNIPSTLVLLATIVFSVLWLAELGISFAERFRQEDLDATGASILFGVANGLFVISWAAIGGFLVTAGVASLWSRALPSLLGWAAPVIGIGMVLSVAAPLTALWLFAYLLFFLWVIATSVLFLRGKTTT